MNTEHTAQEAIDLATEEHYSPQQVADIYNISVDTVIRWFRKEPGVIEVGSDETLYKRRKKLMRIPKSVLQRFHEKQRTVK